MHYSIKLNRKYFILFFIFLATQILSTYAQSKFSAMENLFTEPKKYIVNYHANPPMVDGKLDDLVWKNIPWSEYFRDIEGDKKPDPTWNTRVKMTWDDKGLYIAAEMIEPHVWAYLKNYDDIVFYDNDFEIFIDPDNDTHQYYEFEVNALNTMFDLFMPKPYRNSSGPMIVYNAPGMKWAVDVQGTINDPSDVDQGWTAEIFIPFEAVTIGVGAKIPNDGEFWRINFSRVQWDTEIEDGKYVKKKDENGKVLPEHNWVWSPQGVVNMHFPERWGYLFFSKPEDGSKTNNYSIPFSEEQKKHLWHVYYLQKEYFQNNKTYASDLSKLGIQETLFDVKGLENKLWMEATSRQFMVYISNNQHIFSLNDEGLVNKLK
jgi:hypothetical protein